MIACQTTNPFYIPCTSYGALVVVVSGFLAGLATAAPGLIESS